MISCCFAAAAAAAAFLLLLLSCCCFLAAAIIVNIGTQYHHWKYGGVAGRWVDAAKPSASLLCEFNSIICYASIVLL